jgi:hypothetical protein
VQLPRQPLYLLLVYDFPFLLPVGVTLLQLLILPEQEQQCQQNFLATMAFPETGLYSQFQSLDPGVVVHLVVVVLIREQLEQVRPQQFHPVEVEVD